MFTFSLLFVLCIISRLSLANPCADVASLYRNSSDLQPKVPAELALQCLTDVAFDSAAAGPWLDSLEPYIEWQTTTAYLKDPPEGYLMPPIDIWSRLKQIKQKAHFRDGYENEYEIGRDIYELFQKTYDGHFRYIPRIMNIFAFGRPVSLISYSVDGLQTPKIYVYNDVLSTLLNGSTKAFSAISRINGQEPSDYLEEWSMHGILQDPDALYNNVFFNLAQASLDTYGTGPGTFAGAGRGAYVYPGAETILTFENGTTKVFENFARVMAPFGNIMNGSDLYKRWLNPDYDVSFHPISHPQSKSESMKASEEPSPSLEGPPGYPKPVALDYGNSIGGYYLDQPGYEDVAVLGVASFLHDFDFQDVAYEFLDKATKDGKTKLIIDLSANGMSRSSH